MSSTEKEDCCRWRTLFREMETMGSAETQIAETQIRIRAEQTIYSDILTGSPVSESGKNYGVALCI